jgi:hypothetical protein
MYCELPESRKKRSVEFKVLATGYYISVSNNGDNYTDPLTILVYDSVCYECNAYCRNIDHRNNLFYDDNYATK